MAKWINSYLLTTQIWVSICFTCLAAFLQVAIDGNYHFFKLFILFFTCFGGYQFFKYQEQKSSFSLYSIIVSCIVVLCSLAYLQDIFVFLTYSLFSSLSLLYQFDYGKISFRRLPFVKIFHISLLWTFWLIIFNTENYNYVELVSCFLYVFALTLPFDIKDMEKDHCVTLPKYLGIQKTLYIMFLGALINVFLLLMFPSTIQVEMIVVNVILMISTFFINKKNKDFTIFFGLEGVSIICIIMFLIKNLFFV